MCGNSDCSHGKDAFSGFGEDDFDAQQADIEQATREIPGVETPGLIPVHGVDYEEESPAPTTYVEICQKCRGTGRFLRSISGGKCYACKGAGKFVRKTSPEVRAKARARDARVKTAQATSVAQAAEAWKLANPAEYAWLAARYGKLEFATSIADAIAKYGHLTEKQEAAVKRLCAQDAERDATRKVEAVQRVETAKTVGVSAVERAFDAARSRGVRTPKLRLDTFVFSAASASGKNAGAIYVKDKESDAYLGKIAGGKFLRVRECGAETEARVAAAASDPHNAAIAYGRRFGECCVCGRELTKHASIDKGIGPICEGRFFG